MELKRNLINLFFHFSQTSSSVWWKLMTKQLLTITDVKNLGEKYFVACSQCFERALRLLLKMVMTFFKGGPHKPVSICHIDLWSESRARSGRKPSFSSTHSPLVVWPQQGIHSGSVYRALRGYVKDGRQKERDGFYFFHSVSTFPKPSTIPSFLLFKRGP